MRVTCQQRLIAHIATQIGKLGVCRGSCACAAGTLAKRFIILLSMMGTLYHPERHGCKRIEDPFAATMNGVAPAVAAQSGMVADYRVYPGRFYVLIAFALLAGQQALAWMTFGTIPNESFAHFGLTDDEVTLLSGIMHRSRHDSNTN